MSKKLAAQALDTLLSGQSTGRISKRGSTSGPAKKIRSLPATKTGLKKIKHQLRYGHSVKRAQEAAAAKENPLGMHGYLDRLSHDTRATTWVRFQLTISSFQ